ncbi:hypothetical protein EKO27_g9904 [Xylaria grammica]|uniref:Uncharacterized protein n=1 Tax=Xylaria grammica TaxID=363999 RepID=A0A439CSR2_9PEZI|nr:hypothetical protein EKO27_g9904 [Xylaria grammica]
MLFAFTSTLVLAMAATIIGHPLESRNTQAGSLDQNLNRRNPLGIPISVVESLIGGVTKAGAYDEDIEAADPAEVFGREAGDNIRVFQAYGEDIEAADPAEVLGRRAGDNVRVIHAAYDEDIAAADPAEVLGKRANDIPIISIE